MKVLIVDDEQLARQRIHHLLNSIGDYDVVGEAATGEQALVKTQNSNPDIVLMDIRMPGMDGIALLEKVRNEAKRVVPVLILTARDTLQDKVAGLDAGADDYLVKPFEIKELEARVRAMIRRQRGLVSPEKLHVADLVFDSGTMEVSRANTSIKLTPIGIKILKILMHASPRVVSRREIERQVWGDILPDSDTLRSHIYNLRKSIDKPFEKQLMETMQNTGFRLVDPDDK